MNQERRWKKWNNSERSETYGQTMGSANLINIRQENLMALHGSIAKVMFNGAGGLRQLMARQNQVEKLQKVVPKTEAH